MHLDIIQLRKPLEQGLGCRAEVRNRYIVMFEVLTVVNRQEGNSHLRVSICPIRTEHESTIPVVRKNLFLDLHHGARKNRRNLLQQRCGHAVMRIALCLEYPLELRGGVSVLVETLAARLAALGHRIVLVSPDTAATLQGRGELFDHHIYWNCPKPSIANSRQLAEQLAASRIDVAHFHAGGYYGWGNRLPFHCPIYYLQRLNVPCIFTSHLVVDVFNGYCGPQKPAWFKLLMLPLAWSGKMHQLWHSRYEIAVSQHDFKKLRRWFWPLRSRFVQIYHSRLSGKPREPKAPRKPIILNVGHLAWRKGQLVLVEAFARIAARQPHWSLQLAGSCAEQSIIAEIDRLAKQHHLQDRILFLGERTDAIELMQSAAIYVQPSFWEALGLALQEAMFSGCACIGSRVGGIPELIQDEKSGLLFHPGNIAELANALERLIDNQAGREDFGRAAMASIYDRGMTVEKMTERNLEVYERAVRNA